MDKKQAIFQSLKKSSSIFTNQKLINELGLIPSCCLSFLISKAVEEKEKEWIRVSTHEMEEKLNFSKFKQRKNLKLLEKKNLLEIRRKSVSAKRFVRLNWTEIEKLICKNNCSSDCNSDENDCSSVRNICSSANSDSNFCSSDKNTLQFCRKSENCRSRSEKIENLQREKSSDGKKLTFCNDNFFVENDEISREIDKIFSEIVISEFVLRKFREKSPVEQKLNNQKINFFTSISWAPFLCRNEDKCNAAFIPHSVELNNNIFSTDYIYNCNCKLNIKNYFEKNILFISFIKLINNNFFRSRALFQSAPVSFEVVSNKRSSENFLFQNKLQSDKAKLIQLKTDEATLIQREENISSDKSHLLTNSSAAESDWSASDRNAYCSKKIDSNYDREKIMKRISSSISSSDSGNAAESRKPRLLSERKLPSVVDSYPLEVKEIFTYWNSLGKPLTRHRPNGKTAERACRAVLRALRKHSVDEIKKAIKLYWESLQDPSMKLNQLIRIPGWKVGLNEFFGFSSITRKAMNANKKSPTRISSWFKECLKGKEYLKEKYSALPKDEWPEATELFRKKWKSMEYYYDLSKVTSEFEKERVFRLASRRLKNLLDKYKGYWRFPPVERNTDGYVSLVFECLENKGLLTSKTSPYILISDDFWKQLIRYAEYVGVLVVEE